MKRVDYIREIETRISKLNPIEIEDALSYYQEIFDERGIGDQDEVPDDMPSPRTASFEILRDQSIDNMQAEEESRREKKASSTFGTLALWVLALPIALPLAIALLAVVFAIVVSVLAVGFGFTVAGIAGIGAGIYQIFTSPFTIPKVLYLLGVIMISTAVVILAVLAVRGFFRFIREKLIDYRNKRR